MKRKTEMWPLDALHDHPSQAANFGDVSEEALAELAKDMAERGQQTPVEILSDGTIITGHQRVRAGRLNCWEKIEVVVRHDLDEASANRDLDGAANVPTEHDSDV